MNDDDLLIAILTSTSSRNFDVTDNIYLTTSLASLVFSDIISSHSTSVRWIIIVQQDQREFQQNSDKRSSMFKGITLDVT